VFYKENKKIQRMAGKTDLTKNEFIEWSLALWNFPPETRQKEFGHPAMFPEELPRRCIKMFSFTDSTVLDPFSGAGTTAVVCKKLGRNFIGFETSKTYCEITEERLKFAKKEELYEKLIDINEVIDSNYKEPIKQLRIEDYR
jgi:DNA modification methylase